jgi:hypothetical protein
MQTHVSYSRGSFYDPVSSYDGRKVGNLGIIENFKDAVFTSYLLPRAFPGEFEK